MPEGWVIPAESEAQAATAETYGIYDPHAGDTYVQLSKMHETAGSDGGVITCADCHDTQTIVCAQCHEDVFTEENTPEGWTLAPESEAKAATAETYGVYDMHEGDTYVQFSTMHETAGSNGVISCNDCHDTQTIVCAQCHEDVFTEENTPEGWTLSVNEAKAATAETYGVYDPHSSDYVQFSPMHETAGADGGVITCNDCHETQTIACAMCQPQHLQGQPARGLVCPRGCVRQERAPRCRGGGHRGGSR